MRTPISVNQVMRPAGIDDHGPFGQETPLIGRQARQVEHDLLLSALPQIYLRAQALARLPMGGHGLVECLANPPAGIRPPSRTTQRAQFGSFIRPGRT